MKKLVLVAFAALLLVSLAIPAADAEERISIEKDLPGDINAGDKEKAGFTVTNNTRSVASVEAYLEMDPNDGGLYIIRNGRRIDFGNKGRCKVEDFDLGPGSKKDISFVLATEINAVGTYNVSLDVEGKVRLEEAGPCREPPEEPPKEDDTGFRDIEEEEEGDLNVGGWRDLEEERKTVSHWTLLALVLIPVSIIIAGFALEKRRERT